MQGEGIIGESRELGERESEERGGKEPASYGGGASAIDRACWLLQDDHRSGAEAAGERWQNCRIGAGRGGSDTQLGQRGSEGNEHAPWFNDVSKSKLYSEEKYIRNIKLCKKPTTFHILSVDIHVLFPKVNFIQNNTCGTKPANKIFSYIVRAYI